MRLTEPLLILLQRCGFDRPRFVTGFQIACVAFAALAFCWALGLEHPQWAAITVFVTLQPTRGQIIEKSGYRAMGTLAGSAFGAATVWLAQGNLGIELLAVSTWAAAMVWLGSLQRAYRSYASLLAGYSAIIVVVLAPFDPETVQAVALSRVATVLVGLLAGLIWLSLFRVGDARDEVQVKLRRLTADILHQVGGMMQAGSAPDMARLARLTSAGGLLLEECNTLTANGKSNGLQSVESMLQGLATLLLVAPHHATEPRLGEHLQAIANHLHGQNTFAGLARHLRRSLALTDDPVLEETLTALMVHAENLEQPRSALRLRYDERRRHSLDWAGAGQGAVRVFAVLALISLGWWLTDAPVFQYPLVSAAICMALTSTGVTPARKMQDVLRGQVLAAMVALGVECILWRLFPSATGQLAALLLPALIFAFVRSHRATSLAAPDYAITVFLLLSPSYLEWETTMNPWLRAAMAVGGAALGYLAFLLIFPTDARSRRKALWRMIKRDLQEVTRQANHTLDAAAWRQSFARRFLRITFWADQEQGRYERSTLTLRKGLVTMQLAEVVYALRALQARADLSDSLRRAVDASLERVRISRTDNRALRRSITRLAERLDAAGHRAEAEATRHAYAELSALSQDRLIQA